MRSSSEHAEAPPAQAAQLGVQGSQWNKVVNLFLPQIVWPHLGFLLYGLRPGLHSRWSHTCAAFLITLNLWHKRSFIGGSLARNLGAGCVNSKFGDPVLSSSVFEGSLARNGVAGGLSTSTPCSFFPKQCVHTLLGVSCRDNLSSLTESASWSFGGASIEWKGVRCSFVDDRYQRPGRATPSYAINFQGNSSNKRGLTWFHELLKSPSDGWWLCY